MKRFVRHIVPLIVSALIAWISPSALPREAAPDIPDQTLTQLLPVSTVAAVEIRDLDRRWSEIRGLPAIARFQDRFLAGLGLSAADLRGFAGDRAVLALVTASDGRSVIPLGLVRPPRLAEATARLEELRVSYRLERDAIWLVPSADADRLKRLVLEPRADGDRDFRLDELDRSLPSGGLVRGWINPVALRGLLLHQLPGTKPALVELLAALGAAELEAVRFAGFRRDLTADGVLADAIVGYDTDLLPPEVTRALGTLPRPSLLPPTLPSGIVAMAAFRPEAEASLAWLRHASASDPRGPLRNFEFWLDELQGSTGLDIERDLLDHLGDQGWLVVFEGDSGDTVQVAIVFEVEDAMRVEGSLVQLRSWWMEEAWGRSLGFVIPRAHESNVSGSVLHAMTLWTLLGEAPGPAFLVHDGHLLVATTERAVTKSLQLLAGKESWTATVTEPDLPVPAHESMIVSGAALARLLEVLRTTEAGDPAVAEMTAAFSELAAELGSISGGVWYEGDAVRLRGRVRFR